MTTIFNERNEIKTINDNPISAQYPLCTDGDSVYEKDIVKSLNNIGTFTGDILSLFNSLDTSIIDTSITNPKYLEFSVERPFRSGSVALIAKTGDFSNIKIIYRDRQNTIIKTIDDSANNTKYTSHKFDVIDAANVCCVRVEFHTSDPVTLSFIYLRKVNTVRSYVSGTRDDGTRGNIVLDDANNLRTNSFPYTYSISEGTIAGHYPLLKFGTRTLIAANIQSLIWEGTNALYTYLASAERLKISSSSSSDTSNGVGARTVSVLGLDANFLEILEVITMNGITPVETSNLFIRIFRSYVSTCGTSLTNVGKITITNNAGTVEQAVVNANDGQTLMTMWTVPADKTAYMVQGTTSTDSNKGARVSFFTRLNDGGILYPWQIKYRAYLFSGNEIFPFVIPFKILAKTDIEVRVTTPASAGVTSAGATFELWYET